MFYQLANVYFNTIFFNLWWQRGNNSNANQNESYQVECEWKKGLEIDQIVNLQFSQTHTCFHCHKSRSHHYIIYISGRKGCIKSTRAFLCTSSYWNIVLAKNKIPTNRENQLIKPEAIVLIISKIQNAAKLDET